MFIIVDIDAKRLHIWKGNEAPVRQKFISARVAQDIRLKEYGMAFKVESQDQGEESDAFLSMFGVTSSTSSSSNQSSAPIVSAAPAGVQPVVATKPVPASPQPVASARPAPAFAEPTIASQQPVASAKPVSVPSQPASNPQPVASARPAPPRAERIEPVHHAPTDIEISKSTSSVTPPSQDLIDKTVEKLKELDEPEGMQREIVIIGQSVFSAHKEYHKLFKKEIVKLDPMDDLPPGAFPANDYYARLFIENGKVIFIELFTETPASAREEFLADMRSSLRDLTKLGI